MSTDEPSAPTRAAMPSDDDDSSSVELAAPDAEHAPSLLGLYELPADRPVIALRELADRLRQAETGGRISAVDACPGATALVVRHLLERGLQALVVVTPDRPSAEQLLGDLAFVLGSTAQGTNPSGPASDDGRPTVLSVFAPESSPWAAVAPNRRATQRRLAALLRLASAPGPNVVVVDAPSLVRRVVPRATVVAESIDLRAADEVDREALGRRLTERGYVRSPVVDDPGSFAMRGGIVDVWPAGAPAPVRLELDGDLVASLRRFDPEDQRTVAEIDEVWLPPASEMVRTAERLTTAAAAVRDICDAIDWPSARTRALIEDLTEGRLFFGADAFVPAFSELEPLVDQLDADSAVVLEDPAAIRHALQAVVATVQTSAVDRDAGPRFAPERYYTDVAHVERWLTRHRVLELVRGVVPFGESALGASIATWDQSDVRRAVEAARAARGFRGSLEPLVRRIRAWQEAGLAVLVATRTTAQCERLGAMLESRAVRCQLAPPGTPPTTATARSETVSLTVGALMRGVVAPTERLVLLTEEEVFGTPTARRRRAPSAEPGKRSRRGLLSDLRDLGVGDHVVHAEHGIGRYLGLVHRDVGGRTVDLLAVEYAGGDKLYVPVYRLNQVQKLRGVEGTPKLDRLGGQTFARAKAKASQRVRQLAEELLRLYAERRAVTGVATPPVDEEYRAFEATFPYEETDDQSRTLAEVSADLEAPRPMDRLVCGDVGFGKTEIALRAAFRVAMAGRQVAVLCPTTVLTQQHLSTFESRLAAYPLRIAALSRFQSKPEQQRAVLGLRQGSLDIVVGTHRLLSRDVHFANLGLLVVDEEQRFGVAAKERIKALRTNVDVLTLSATPIPRTLQMAIGGLRDLSLITTPPADRRAVRTIVTRDDPAVLREAIERELDRGGQIYFVHNRIGSLAARAAAVQQLVPRARIALAHGQMAERTLEQTMLGFVQGHFDLLCCTAIIENGLDIPRCNTIIVDRADRYGLAQLYQLRGRVGRSRERAYCYLVLEAGSPLSDEARLRLDALGRHSELGSGFQIATLDLDLRGAGDLLGAAQSGTVQSVGFEMFCEMLEQAVSELRGGSAVAEVEPELSFDVEALLPEGYVSDVGVRLSLYKRLASAGSAEDVTDLGREIEDRFGPPPVEARALLHLMSIKTELRRLRVLGCEATPQRVTLHLRADAPLDGPGLARLVQTRRGSYRLTPDFKLTRLSGAGERFTSGLDAAERLLAELAPVIRSLTSDGPSPPTQRRPGGRQG